MSDSVLGYGSYNRSDDMRSPNYPAIGLPDAIALAQRIWKKDKRTPVSFKELAVAIGYRSLSGPARTKISALKKYGLISKNGANWKLSDRAMAILHKPRITPDYKDAVAAAIKSVELFDKLLRTHGQASSSTLRSHLIVEHSFTEDGADKFIKAFSATKPLASPDFVGNNTEDDESSEKPSVGDFVQWESQGAAQFPEPRKVTGLSDDGEWAFVEGTEAGLAVAELTIEQSATKESMTPPPNPDFVPDRGDTLALPVLDGGKVSIVHIPKMTDTAFEFFKKLLETYKPAIVARANPIEPDKSE